MKNSGNWIVGLDFSAMDSDVIAYTSFIAQKFKPAGIYFMHVYPDLNVPESLRTAIPSFSEPADERILKRMKGVVKDFFIDAKDFKIEYLVVEGDAETQFLHWADIKQADLIIMGRKEHAGGSGIIPKRVARKSQCSILFVPKHGPYSLDTVMVPTDFSEASKKAIELGVIIKKRVLSSKLFLFHSCQIPSVIYYDSIAGSSMDELIREAAEQQFADLLKSLQIGEVSTLIDTVTNRNPGSVIAQNAIKITADLVLISGNNKHGLGRLLLGSSTESLVSNLTDIPVLVVKGASLQISLGEGSDLLAHIKDI